MKNKLMNYTSEDHLRERLKDPKFKKAWDDSEPDYILAKKMIEKRLAKKISQRALAKKLKTTQAVISRIETMRANPSLSLLKRIATSLDAKLELRFK
jgi:ribosome-binding protein aMBF1 (putative translation factor)